MSKSLREALESVSLIEIHRVKEELSGLDLRHADFDRIYDLVGHLINQMPFRPRPLLLNGVYRARPNKGRDPFRETKELWEPPAEYATRGRINAANVPIFYGAINAGTALQELRPMERTVYTITRSWSKSGDLVELRIVTLGIASGLSPLFASAMSEVAQSLRAMEIHVGWSNFRKFRTVDRLLTNLMVQEVAPGDGHLYAPTNALADLLFYAPGIDGLVYPSVATEKHGVNIGLLPPTYHEHFYPEEAWMVEFGEPVADGVWESSVSRRPLGFRPIRRTTAIDPASGEVSWLPEGQFDLTDFRRFLYGI